ncbi:MAG: Rpn family recombination-promoting nuclease/putative transposase [Marinospirillum sp.]|uniref:Rpn family recombination-promoting nuclease/putative transposase n=1 Tax=Marinospirillum sp. TaxID=2183934 RepID=UPI0019F9768A|nr:Rpn family recombination-promoting nuclease/putative transposase [Marinospirillum sp.]MBE0506305.1 Rpn family recombination-promoting nuclease/putative transposase [Marinospirillum sp.]
MSLSHNDHLLDPKIDFVFKKIFTAHPDALVHLINDLRPDLPVITQITILNPEITAKDLTGKNIVMDLLAEDSEGEQYNIEMQVRNYNDWNKRGIYYLAQMLASQLQAGESYANLKGAVGIHLLDFDLFKETQQQKQQALWRFEMRDGLQPKVKLGEDLQLNIIEMKKADRLGLGSQAIRDWITLFEHWKEEDKMSVITNPAVQQVRGYIRELSADEKARQLAEARAKAIRDEASLIEDALKKGRQEGISIGEVKGEAQTLLKLIKLKFGQHPEWVESRLNEATKDQLDVWVGKILTAATLDELLTD